METFQFIFQSNHNPYSMLIACVHTNIRPILAMSICAKIPYKVPAK